MFFRNTDLWRFRSTVEAQLWSIVGLVSVALSPVVLGFVENEWAADSQSHGPIIGAVSAWLFYARVKDTDVWARANTSESLLALVLVIFGSAMLIVGETLDIPTLKGASIIFAFGSAVIVVGGLGLAKRVWFPILFLVFLIPLPASFVSQLTQPLKLLVSIVVEFLLDVFDYPISRQGVILFLGQYRLLVADACAGLNSIFTLEALGLLYLSLQKNTSALRLSILAAAILPISITSNVVRVIILCLVTYYFGDEAGQGYVHDFAGMTLFMVGLVLMVAFDGLVTKILNRTRS